MTAHSSILAWKTPWIEEPGRLQVHGFTKSWTGLSMHAYTQHLAVWLPYALLRSIQPKSWILGKQILYLPWNILRWGNVFNFIAVVIQLLVVSDSVTPMDCNEAGFPDLHYLPEFAQIHVY